MSCIDALIVDYERISNVTDLFSVALYFRRGCFFSDGQSGFPLSACCTQQLKSQIKFCLITGAAANQKIGLLVSTCPTKPGWMDERTVGCMELAFQF